MGNKMSVGSNMILAQKPMNSLKNQSRKNNYIAHESAPIKGKEKTVGWGR